MRSPRGSITYDIALANIFIHFVSLFSRLFGQVSEWLLGSILQCGVPQRRSVSHL